MKKISTLFLALIASFTVFAQGKSEILNSSKEITWLGIDFSQLKFIGNASQYKDAGEITNANLRDKYFPAWNILFVNEQKKYDIAGAVNRTEVKYAIDVTEKSNNALKGNFLSDDLDEYKHLDKEKITGLLSKYDYQGNKGIGMMFIVESMSKGREEASIWVTFVDMNSKKLVLAHRVLAKAGGMGFRNYWAKSIYNALKETGKSLGDW